MEESTAAPEAEIQAAVGDIALAEPATEAEPAQKDWMDYEKDDEGVCLQRFERETCREHNRFLSTIPSFLHLPFKSLTFPPCRSSCNSVGLHAGYNDIMLSPIERSFDDANRNITINDAAKREENGRIPLWIAANLGNFGHVRLYLKGTGVDPNTVDNDGASIWLQTSVLLYIKLGLRIY